MPRATKLTDAVTDQIAIAVRAGAAFKVAAATAGTSETTFHTWMARGRAERDRLLDAEAILAALPRRTNKANRTAARKAMEPLKSELPFLRFLERVERADAEAQVRAAEQISTAGADDWRAAAWLLERRDPHTFGPPKERLAVEGSAEKAPIQRRGVDAKVEADAAREFLRTIADAQRRALRDEPRQP